MTTIRAFINRHPVLAYYALAFAISWGGFSPYSLAMRERTPRGST